MMLAAYANETDRLAKLYGLPIFPMGDTVPKVIRQTFPTKVLPLEFEAHVETLRGLNVSWDYQFYDDTEIDKFVELTYGSNVSRLLNSIRPTYGAARADLFRYLLMYRLGGVYLDIKSGFDRPIDQAIQADEKFLISQWNTSDPSFFSFGQHKELEDNVGGEYQNWQIITVPGHPFLRAVIARVLHNIDTYNAWKHGTGKEATLRVTGPIAYTRAIKPLLDHYPHRMVIDCQVGLVYAAVKQHRMFFKRHYVTRTDPLIKWRGPASLLDWSYHLVRQIRQRLPI